MDLPVVMGYGHFLMLGLLYTVSVSIAAAVFGLTFGALGCAARLSRHQVWRRLVAAYVLVFQSLPELLVVLVVYFSGDSLLKVITGELRLGVSPFVAGTFALALAMGAYATDILRSAYLQVPHGLREAANALGLRRWQSLMLIDAPQIFRLALPPLGNLFLVVQKNSALVSVIGLSEVMRQAQVAAGATHDPLSFYMVAGVLYLSMAAVTMLVQQRTESRLAQGMGR